MRTVQLAVNDTDECKKYEYMCRGTVIVECSNTCIMTDHTFTSAKRLHDFILSLYLCMFRFDCPGVKNLQTDFYKNFAKVKVA